MDPLWLTSGIAGRKLLNTRTTEEIQLLLGPKGIVYANAKMLECAKNEERKKVQSFQEDYFEVETSATTSE
jgi:hypothetical protein